MTNLLPAIMRTGVPIIYALLIKLGVARLGLPDAAVTDVATVVLTVVLYVLLRLLERAEPWIGAFLGWIGEPQYASVVQGEVTSVHDELLADLVDEVAKLKDRAEAIGEKVAAKVADDAETSAAASTAAPVVAAAATVIEGAATDVEAEVETAAPALDTLLVPALRDKAKTLKVTGYSSMTKAELVAAIKAAQQGTTKTATQKGA